MKKYIREGRMGPPFSYKTGAVVETYPKPMLVLEFDAGGLDVVKQSIVELKPQELSAQCKTAQDKLPPIQAILFSALKAKTFDLGKRQADNSVALNFLDVINTIIRDGCPWKTIVLDPLTGLSEAYIGHISVTDSAAMNDARQWASQVGVLLSRTVNIIQGLPCHSVFIMHVETEKNETTGEVNTDPMMPSKQRQSFARSFSSFFYAAIEGGKPVVYVQPTGFVKCVGIRKPNAPASPKLGATFQEIYGSDPDIIK